MRIMRIRGVGGATGRRGGIAEEEGAMKGNVSFTSSQPWRLYQGEQVERSDREKVTSFV